MPALTDTFFCILTYAKEYQTLIASAVAAIIAWRFNSNKIKLDTESFKRDLFLRYNEKYDSLNDQLEDLAFMEFEIQRDHQIDYGRSLEMIWSELFEDEPTKTPDFIDSIYDYINLCSEEYYWYKKDLIDADVWKCWKKGMQNWYRDSYFIRKIVDREVEKGSAYYNSDFLSLFRSEEAKSNVEN